MAESKKDPGVFVRLRPKDYASAKRIAKNEDMPLSVWARKKLREAIEFEREEHAAK